jgi:hypothetical protein
MNTTGDTMVLMQALSQDIQTLNERMDFFEAIVVRLLVGLQEAGIIVESEEEEEADDNPLVIAT